jgi:HEAT repeat protein
MNKQTQQTGDRNLSANDITQSVVITGDHNPVTFIISSHASTPSLPPERLTALWQDYATQLATRVGTVRIFDDKAPHPLDQVFVELSLNEEYERRPDQAEFLGLMDSELRRMRSVFGDADDRHELDADDPTQRHRRQPKRTLKPDELLRRHTHAVITGAPGCGKTTLLRYLAWQTLKRWRGTFVVSPSSVTFVVPPSGGSSGTAAPNALASNLPPEGGTTNAPLPLFLELKQLTAAAFQAAQGQLEDLLFNAAIAARLKPNNTERDALKQNFYELLRAGRVAIFLDGLDEVSGAGFFGDLQTAVGDFLQSAYGQNTVIISTRPYALRQFGNAKMLEILPLNPRQIEQFIAHYYRDVPERQQFQRELQRRRELRELARVPALLGFILQLWRKRGTVTDDKLELYAQITLELAAQLDTEKEGIAPDRKWRVPDEDGSLKLDLLRQVAFNQLFKGLIRPPYDIGSTDNDATRLVFTGEQLRDEAIVFARTLKEHEGTNIKKPRDLAKDVIATPLLRQVGADHYAFAHLTLQEYLAAWQLAKRDNGDTCERIFCRAYFNPTLAEMEVLPMTLGLVDEPDKFYEALEQLPESLDFKGLRVRARGLSYSVEVGNAILNLLADRLAGFVMFERVENSNFRARVIQSFTGMRMKADAVVIDRISEIFKHPEPIKRENAAEALGVIKTRRAVDSLLAARHDPHEWVRQAVILSLGDCEQEEIEELILVLVREGHRCEREAAVHALRKIGTARAVEGIQLATRDTDSWIKTIATQYLQEIQVSEAFKALDRNREVAAGSSTTLQTDVDEGEVSESLLLLFFGDSNRSAEAAKRLSRMSNKSLIPGLFQAVLHEEERVKELAMTALTYLVLRDSKQLIEVLNRLVKNAHPQKFGIGTSQALFKFQRKLQYFDISNPTSGNNDSLLAGSSPPLTAQARLESEMQIATKYQEVLHATNAGQKGKALEELLAALFATIPGFTVSERNYHTATEELDLVLRNASADPFWRGWGSLILVEAKHWHAQRVGKNEYVQFYRKLETRGGHCQLGFLICTERFAETLHREALRDSKDRLRVVPIDGADLRRLVEAADRDAVLRALVERTVLT